MSGKMQLVKKHPGSLEIGEITEVNVSDILEKLSIGLSEHLFIGRTKKGYYPEVKSNKEIIRVITRGEVDYL
jgi:hypothetical protein